MPANVVKTERDRRLWEKAKELAKKQYPDRTGDSFWASVMSIFIRMRDHIGGGKYPAKASLVMARKFLKLEGVVMSKVIIGSKIFSEDDLNPQGLPRPKEGGGQGKGKSGGQRGGKNDQPCIEDGPGYGQGGGQGKGVYRQSKAMTKQDILKDYPPAFLHFIEGVKKEAVYQAKKEKPKGYKQEDVLRKFAWYMKSEGHEPIDIVYAMSYLFRVETSWAGNFLGRVGIR